MGKCPLYRDANMNDGVMRAFIDLVKMKYAKRIAAFFISVDYDKTDFSRRIATENTDHTFLIL